MAQGRERTSSKRRGGNPKKREAPGRPCPKRGGAILLGGASCFDGEKKKSEG